MSLALLSGCSCSTSLECTTGADCAAGLACVNNECVSLTPLADGGRDAGDDPAPDAATGEDAGSDSGTACARECGDVDVDADEDVDERDLAALPALTAADGCVRDAADVDQDGDYDGDDTHALRALASGGATGECAACGACGDVNADGAVDGADSAAAAESIGGTATVCELLGADVDRSGAVDQLDAWLVRAIAEGRASAECVACDAERLCGDVNADDDVDALDTSSTVAAALGDVVLTPCAYASADVVADGVVDRRDAYAVHQVIVDRLLGATSESACTSCTGTGVCGDVNRDGTVGSGDAIAIANIATGGENDICERALADLNADGQVNGRDATLARDTYFGLVSPAVRCPICSLTCGDVNQDESVDVFDTTRLIAIIGGATSTICERDAADLNGDAAIDARDDRLVRAASTGAVSTTGPCALCTGVCGDLTGDRAVTAADRTRVTEIIDGRRPTICELDDGDVDHDGDVDAADRDLITAIIGGTPPAMPCGR